MPDDDGADHNGVAFLVVDLLLVVVEGDLFKRNALRRHDGNFRGGTFGGFRRFGKRSVLRRRVDGGSEGIDVEKAGAGQRSVILTEKGEHIGFVGAERLEPAKQDRNNDKSKKRTADDADKSQHGRINGNGAADKDRDGEKLRKNEEQKHRHPVSRMQFFFVFLIFEIGFVHVLHSFLNEYAVYDIFLISHSYYRIFFALSRIFIKN